MAQGTKHCISSLDNSTEFHFGMDTEKTEWQDQSREYEEANHPRYH